jgi:hypothetical protein
MQVSRKCMSNSIQRHSTLKTEKKSYYAYEAFKGLVIEM